MHLTAITMEEFPTNLYRLVNLTDSLMGWVAHFIIGTGFGVWGLEFGLGMGTGLVKFLVDPILFGSVRSSRNANLCLSVRSKLS